MDSFFVLVCSGRRVYQELSDVRLEELAGMQKSSWRRLEYGSLTLLVVAAAAGWLYVIYNQHRANDPVEIVKKHFVFYPEYSHGVWRQGQCAHVDKKGCREVNYTIQVKSCGTVNFEWRVFPDEDATATWTYVGGNPRIDENKYPLFAMLNEDSRLIESPALGSPLPETCRLK